MLVGSRSHIGTLVPAITVNIVNIRAGAYSFPSLAVHRWIALGTPITLVKAAPCSRRRRFSSLVCTMRSCESSTPETYDRAEAGTRTS